MASAGGGRSRLRRLRRFARDDAGGMLVLSIVALLGMVVFGGIAVDVAHYERTRVRLQTTLDSAVLAAASLTQNLEPREVVESYLDAAGLGHVEVTVETTREELGGALVGRTVRASIEGVQSTLFLRIKGVDRLGLAVAAEATERVADIEISLVLDVSGSMGLDETGRSDPRKIDALKTAAKAFVDDVFRDVEPGRVSVSLVPYSTKVNAGAALLDAFATTSEHRSSHCVDFEADDYRTTAIDDGVRLQRTGHFQFQAWSVNNPALGQWVCRIDDGFEITPLSQSPERLKARIDALSPQGSTSIDMGVKWGAALLDPSTRDAVSSLVAAGVVDRAFEGRPHAHGARDALKILVIMTDGRNDLEFRLRPEFASGPSDVFRMAEVVGGQRFYSVLSPETWSSNDGDRFQGERFHYAIHPFRSTAAIWENVSLLDHPSLAAFRGRFVERRLDWPEVWAEMSPIYYAYNLRAKQWNDWRQWSPVTWALWDDIHDVVDRAEKDARLADICAAARGQGIVVFSIGFEVASDSSLELLENCASSEAHYFDVEGLEIEEAFEMVASSISMLRLTR